CCGACAAATGWARRRSRTACPPTASWTRWPARPWARRPRTWPSATPAGAKEQDAFALQSQRRAAEAWAAGRFADEVVPVDTFDAKRRTVTVERDEHPRPATTRGGLAKLKPVFRNPGTVTPGNSSGICDGAAALVVMGGGEGGARR